MGISKRTFVVLAAVGAGLGWWLSGLLYGAPAEDRTAALTKCRAAAFFSACMESKGWKIDIAAPSTCYQTGKADEACYRAKTPTERLADWGIISN